MHDISAARIHVLPALYRAAAAGCSLWPILDTTALASESTSRSSSHPAGRTSISNTRTRNALLRSLRCLGERGFALVTGRWRALQHITVSPGQIGDIARAALVLTHFEYGYIK